MDKEIKILLITILTLLFYGIFLLIDNKPFYIYPLNVMANLAMTATIVFTLRKFDWRNLLYLVVAFVLLFQDPLFLSFFHVDSLYLNENLGVWATVFILTLNMATFIPVLEKKRLVFGLILLLVSSFTIIFYGMYGTLLSCILALFLIISSENKNIEFLKVYFMFFIFMLLNQAATENIYN